MYLRAIGSAYVAGYTRSPNFPTINPLQPAFAGPCFRTTDGAASWDSINNGFASWGAPALAISSSVPTTVYAAGEQGSGIFKSTDGGANWLPANNGLSTSNITSAVAVDPTDSTIVYAAYGLSLMKSTNGGAGWFFSGSGLSSVMTACLAIDPVNPTTLYAGAAPPYPRSVFKSTDAGATWVHINNGLGSGITSIAIDPTN